MLKLLGGLGARFPENLEIWVLRDAISCILSHFQATFIVFAKKKVKERCPNYFRDLTRHAVLDTSIKNMYCENSDRFS